MKSITAESVAKTTAAAAVCSVFAVGLVACSGSPSSAPTPSQESSERQASATSYPKIVVSVAEGQVNFAPRSAKTRKDMTDEVMKKLGSPIKGSRNTFRLPNRSIGIQTVNGNNWYVRNGYSQYEVTVWGKDIDRRNGKVHVEGGMNVPNAVYWQASDYRNEFVIQPIISDGQVKSLRILTTDKANIGGGAHKWYDYSIDKTVGIGGGWDTLVDPKASDHGHMSGRLNEAGLSGVWKFLPKLSVLTQKQSDGTIEVQFKEAWNDTFVLTSDNGTEELN